MCVNGQVGDVMQQARRFMLNMVSCIIIYQKFIYSEVVPPPQQVKIVVGTFLTKLCLGMCRSDSYYDTAESLGSRKVHVDHSSHT